MSSLAHLRISLRQAHAASLERFGFDTKAIDGEVERLQKWIGGRGSDKPPADITAAALNAFYQSQELPNLREARLICYGCLDPVLPDRRKLIEDPQRFPVLLGGVDGYLTNHKAFRSCYRGLLRSYFGYDPDNGHEIGRRNWERLRSYLRERITHTTAPGWSPEWVDALHAHPTVLADNPGETYGPRLLVDDDEQFKHMQRVLDINDASWLVRTTVLGQIDAAAAGNDDSFRAHLAKLLDLLAQHPLMVNEGLKRLLGRYRKCASLVINPRLRDFAVAHWGNPWLSLNKPKWSLVGDDVRQMVADWLKLDLIQRFFNLLAADGMNNPRRLKFWERYHASMDDMYFALGNTAYYDKGADFREIKKKMEGRLLNLQKARSRDNNAFIMCIGEHVVVEFGLTGDACFIFRRDELPFELATAQVSGDSSGLKGMPYVERMLHIDTTAETWEDKFESTIAKLMSVRRGPSISGGSTFEPTAPPTHPVHGATAMRRSSEGGSRQTTPKYAASSSIQNPAVHLADSGHRALDELCRERGFQIEDFREQSGNQWVQTDDSDLAVNAMLRSWGFTYKPGKGWWRK
jgi:hypothetical protein